MYMNHKPRRQEINTPYDCHSNTESLFLVDPLVRCMRSSHSHGVALGIELEPEKAASEIRVEAARPERFSKQRFLESR